MQPVLLDSSIYIQALRAGEEGILASTRLALRGPLWLSAVVLEELYAGVNMNQRHVVERLERDFGSVRRILVPNLNDWTQAGKVLARLGAEFGYEQIGLARLTNDALIAMSAARQGITVITGNERDFARLARFRPFLWEVLSARENSTREV
jgi:predicted nucleic acid-binding protein